MNDEKTKPGTMRLDPSISYGQLITPLIALCGLIFFFAGTSNHSDNADQHAKEAMNANSVLRNDMIQGFAAVRADMAVQFHDLRSDFANFPDVRAAVTQIDKRVGDLTDRTNALSNRIDQGANRGYVRDSEMKAQADAIQALTNRVTAVERLEMATHK